MLRRYWELRKILTLDFGIYYPSPLDLKSMGKTAQESNWESNLSKLLWCSSSEQSTKSQKRKQKWHAKITISKYRQSVRNESTVYLHTNNLENTNLSRAPFTRTCCICMIVSVFFPSPFSCSWIQPKRFRQRRFAAFIISWYWTWTFWMVEIGKPSNRFIALSSKASAVCPTQHQFP